MNGKPLNTYNQRGLYYNRYENIVEEFGVDKVRERFNRKPYSSAVKRGNSNG